MQLLKHLFLRGPVLSGWVYLKIHKWQNRYLHEISGCKPILDKKNRQQKPLVGKAIKKTKLRKMLIVCDEMWERAELLPELRVISNTQLLDVKNVLKNGIIELDKLRKKLLQIGEKSKFDVILLYLNAHWLNKDLFCLVREHCNGYLLGMNLDDKAEFFNFGPGQTKRYDYGKWVKYFDLNLSSSKLFKNFYENQGGNYFYCPPGLHIPDKLSPPNQTKFIRKIGFLGSAKPERVRLIDSLHNLGWKVDTFGAGWPNQGWVDIPRKIFRETQINIGLGFASGSDNFTALKARDFECPGAGACYLTTYNFELCEHWEMGKEILCYRSIAELVEMLGYFKNKLSLCSKIANAAFIRGKKDHTWRRRFEKIFKELGFQI